ncbi:hypothetical protein GH714_025275 [Hevea brasiliensis]|uniref:AIR12 DOMON domain-containing protein n=1 Tax=Hevea brasiliensis TaxID=3981 RepID=A0A6A6KVC7_HEVBR|nr:hypothetical protein GH714_025275 [Hevea brasiliensis]
MVDEKANKVNQVWQVGPSVIDGNPAPHEMKDANTKSTGVLTLVGSGAGQAPGSTTSTPAAATPSPSTEKSEASAIGKLGGLIIVMLGSFIGF